MTYAALGQMALDYFPCRYGTSKLLFRGPRRKLQDDYVTFLGGIETYGKFMETPYPCLVEHETGMKSVNLGCVNAGIDAYLTDKSLINICSGAKATVIQVMGAQNMSNRFYAVHSRRNDRFLHASTMLKTIYPDTDFTEFSFTRHLLNALAKASESKFAMVRQELKDAWVARMKMLITQIDGPVVLLWLTGGNSDGPDNMRNTGALFVDHTMIDAVQTALPQIEIVKIKATDEEIETGFEELAFDELERPAAEEMLGGHVHRRACEELALVLQKIK